MRFHCATLFDITPTGVTGHFKASQVPFKDRAGQLIANEISWNLARNQQRNWETLTQVIGLRAQIHKISTPVRNGNKFEFTFEVETENALGGPNNPTEMLVSDAEGVPMLAELWNLQNIDSTLITSGPKQNIWFTVLG